MVCKALLALLSLPSGPRRLATEQEPKAASVAILDATANTSAHNMLRPDRMQRKRAGSAGL